MTAHQHTVVNQLRLEYGSVAVRPDKDTLSVLAVCYGHTAPDKTFKVSPSGFCQDVTPGRV